MKTRTCLLPAVATVVLASGIARAQTPIVFQPPIGYPPCVGAGPLELADVDRDGLPDVTIGQGPPYNQVCVLRNTGIGGLATGVPIAMGATFSRQKLVDLNDDGYPEIISTHFNPGVFRVRMNLGGGPGSASFGPASPAYALGTFSVNDAASGDFDFDGDVDLAFIGVSGTYPSYVMTISAFANDGTGAFSPLASFPAPGALALAAGDFDGDGDADLAFAGATPVVFVSVSMSSGAGGFDPPWSLTPPATTFLTKLRAVDVDDDGDRDLIAGYDGIWLYTNNGPAGFALSTVYAPGSTFQLAGQWVDADFNCDSHRDYVMSSNTNGMMHLVTGTPSGPSAPVSLGYQAYSLAAGEMNHDAQIDLVCYGEFGAGTMLNDSYTPCFAKDGLVTRVNGAPYSKELKVVHPGDTVAWKTDVAHSPNLRGRPATIFVNAPPESAIIAYTPITGMLPVPGFEAVHFLSVPPGPAYFTGDSLYLGSISIGIDLGYGALGMGDPAYTLSVQAGMLAPGEQVRMQAVFFDPHPNNWWIITATNAVRLEMGP